MPGVVLAECVSVRVRVDRKGQFLPTFLVGAVASMQAGCIPALTTAGLASFEVVASHQRQVSLL